MRIRVAPPVFLSLSVTALLVLTSCSSSNEIVSNYYDDGIYYDSQYGGNWMATDLGLTENGETPGIAEAEAPQADQAAYDYYDPNNTDQPFEDEYYDNGYGSQGYYGSPNITFNLGFGMGYGYNPWYNPYMMYYDPFYPNYGWGMGFGYNPWYGYGNPYNPWGYGYGGGYGYGY
ncbi:MAG: hypothetical protein HWE14_07330, partial [Flavobacteriia bacterium]|nr:hypothetical protein [Flavobacteriia bacterium]